MSRYPTPGDFAKRMFDLFFSLAGLIILSPVFLLIACLIKLEDGGPVFYRGLRVGFGGRPFRIIKFRTMVVDADRRGACSVPQEDPRVTGRGRLLREFKLDEIPQLINVVAGEMSFVGPRPQVDWAVDLYTEEERALLSVRPGITDYASLRFRNEAEILRGSRDPDRDYLEKIAPEKNRLGLEYIRTRSFRVDLGLIVKTVAILAGLGGEGGYAAITEKWGMAASPEQYSMAYCRYRLAGAHAEGKRVLEAACGVGMGLNYLSAKARSVVAGDFTESNVREARSRVGTAIPLLRFDAQRMPFRANSFDTVVLHEAFYYLKSQAAFLEECGRILSDGGILILSLPNKDRPGFIPSPYSTSYPSVPELDRLLRARGFDPGLRGGYPVSQAGFLAPLGSFVRSVAATLGLVPRSLEGRARLKRLLHRKLPILNGIQEGMAETPDLAVLPPEIPCRHFKNLYAVAERRVTGSATPGSS